MQERRRTQRSPSSQDEQYHPRFMRRIQAVEQHNSEITNMMMLLTEVHTKLQEERDEPYKKKKRDCPVPEKFQGMEGEECDT